MDAANRALWTFVALLFIIAGGLGTAASLGALPVSRDTAVLATQFRDGWRSIDGWRWVALIAGGLLLALLGLWLLRAELRWRGGRPMSDLTGDDLRERRPDAASARETGTRETGTREASASEPSASEASVQAAGASEAGGVATERLPGRTRVRASALEHGIEDDLVRYPAVRDATVTLTGDPGRASVLTRLDVGAGTDLTMLRRHVTESLDRFTATTGLRPGDVRIVVRLRGEADSRTMIH